MATTTRLGLNKPANSDVVDVVTAISDQMAVLDSAARCESCTSTTRPTTNLFTGKIAYETDTKSIIKYSGAVWEYVYSSKQSRGRQAYLTTTTVSSTVAANAEAVSALTRTFTAYSGRKYLVLAGGATECVAGVDAPAFVRGRWAAGVSVTTAGTLISTNCADVNDNSVSTADIRWNYLGQFSVTTSGQVTVGITLGRPVAADAKTVRITGFQYLAIEDIGEA